MSAIKLTYLYCDGADCPRADGNGQQPFSIDPLPDDTAGSQRASAREHGWVRRGGKDYCDVCKEKPNA